MVTVDKYNGFNNYEIVKSWKKNQEKTHLKSNNSEDIDLKSEQTDNIIFDSIDVDSKKTNTELLMTAEKTKQLVLEKRKEAKLKKAKEKSIKKNKSASKKTSDETNQSTIKAEFKDLKLKTDQEILSIRFSQNSVAEKSSDNLDLFEVIRTVGWKKGQQVKFVRMPDDQITSIDNRRLLAVKRIVREISTSYFHDKNAFEARCYTHSSSTTSIKGEISNIKATMITRDDLIPIESAELELEENTYGAMIYYRMHVGKGDYAKEPYGFTRDPFVRKEIQNT